LKEAVEEENIENIKKRFKNAGIDISG